MHEKSNMVNNICDFRDLTLAASKNIRLVTTGINGGRVNDIYADFEFSEDGTQALKRPAGHAPKSCRYLKKSGQGSAVV